MRFPALVGFVVPGLAVCIAACGGETDTPYGPPGEWLHVEPPQPAQGMSSSGGSGSTSSSGTATDAAAGESGGGGDASTAGTAGNGECPSWANAVFPALQSDGTCGNGGCHGVSGGQPANEPPFLNGNAKGTYTAFTQYTGLYGKPYVKAGDTDPNDSTIDCSLDAQTCFTLQRMPPVATWTTADRTLVQQWVACGAPEN
jgi:hypothetical protein